MGTLGLTRSQGILLNTFRKVAKRYCAVIEHVGESSDVDLLRKLNDALPELYWRAQRLPDIDPWVDDPEPEDYSDWLLEKPLEIEARGLKVRCETEARIALEEILKGHCSYHSVFDPISDTEAIPGSLANDLAEVYGDLKEQLYLDEHATEVGESETERLWSWRWGLANHWGKYHLPPAISAVCWLLYQYWDEDAENWSTDADSTEQTDI